MILISHDQQIGSWQKESNLVRDGNYTRRCRESLLQNVAKLPLLIPWARPLTLSLLTLHSDPQLSKHVGRIKSFPLSQSSLSRKHLASVYFFLFILKSWSFFFFFFTLELVLCQTKLRQQFWCKVGGIKTLPIRFSMKCVLVVEGGKKKEKENTSTCCKHRLAQMTLAFLSSSGNCNSTPSHHLPQGVLILNSISTNNTEQTHKTKICSYNK